MDSPDTLPLPYRLLALVVMVLALPVTLPFWAVVQLRRRGCDRVFSWDTAPMPTAALEAARKELA